MKLAEIYEIMNEPRKALDLVYQGMGLFNLIVWVVNIPFDQSLILENAAPRKHHPNPRTMTMTLLLPTPPLLRSLSKTVHRRTTNLPEQIPPTQTGSHKPNWKSWKRRRRRKFHEFTEGWRKYGREWWRRGRIKQWILDRALRLRTTYWRAMRPLRDQWRRSGCLRRKKWLIRLGKLGIFLLLREYVVEICFWEIEYLVDLPLLFRIIHSGGCFRNATDRKKPLIPLIRKRMRIKWLRGYSLTSVGFFFSFLSSQSFWCFYTPPESERTPRKLPKVNGVDVFRGVSFKDWLHLIMQVKSVVQIMS